jgi:glycosyltransferase involved in cell wall biosynthesis
VEPQLTIIIPTRNRESILSESLRHLQAATQSLTVETIIVNDGESEIIRIKKLFPFVKIVKNKGRGVASARNTGASLASADILLFMDDDMWVTEDAVKKILKTHVSRNNVALNVNWKYPPALNKRIMETAFGRYLEKNQFTTLKGWNKELDIWKDDQPFVMTSITSQNLSMRRSTFRATGGYNEKFPHAGFEDFEFSKRLNHYDVEILVDPTVITFHNEVDRLDVREWLQRKVRGAETRVVAVEMGYQELALNYSMFKKTLFLVIGLLQPLIIKMVTNVFTNSFQTFDPITFRMLDSLFALAIFKGYQNVDKR